MKNLWVEKYHLTPLFHSTKDSKINFLKVLEDSSSSINSQSLIQKNLI